MVRIAFCAVTALAVFATGGTARGQWFDPCGCAAPVQACCAQPMVQQCYATVPVTEMQEVRQTVQRPVIETAYVDQPVTEYRQVCETKTAQIPTCQYQTVTEYRPVQRDMGSWVTQYQCNPRLAPCQYDSRPDLFGFLNRTGYSLRMAFTPPMTATRSWRSNIVTTAVPVQRQVAIRGSQQVSYQVSKMVPFTTTRKVAVNTVKMVAQEIVTKQPVTVYRTVPTGTATVWGAPILGNGTGTAFGSSINTPRTALQPTPANEPTPAATAERPPEKVTPIRSANELNKLPEALNDGPEEAIPQPKGKTGGMITPTLKEEFARNEPVEVETRKPVTAAAAFASRPSIVRVGRWVARRSTAPTPAAGKSEEMVAENSK